MDMTGGSFSFLFRFFVYLCVWVFSLHVCLCIMFMPVVGRGKDTESAGTGDTMWVLKTQDAAHCGGPISGLGQIFYQDFFFLSQ